MASVLIPLAQGCEELEAVTIIDLLRRAEINVVTAGLDENNIKASRGVVLVPDVELSNVSAQSFDMIILPGGLPGADFLNDDCRIHRLLCEMNEQRKWVAAICAAPKVLASAGLLENKKVTSYPGSLEDYDVSGMVITNASVVVDGHIVTSRGPGTAMDFALTLIELLCGEEKRKAVEKPLLRPEYSGENQIN